MIIPAAMPAGIPVSGIFLIFFRIIYRFFPEMPPGLPDN
jgi:hypothetical protein